MTDETKEAICETIPGHLERIAASIDAIKMAPVNLNDPIPDLSGGIIIPDDTNLHVAKLTTESASDIDALVTATRNRTKEPCEKEVLCQLVFDTETGEIKRVFPVKKNGNFMSLSIKTADGFESYGDYCKGLEDDK